MIYPALSVRTDFSLGESIITVDDLPQIAEDLQTDVIGVCDTMSVSSMIEATRRVKKAGRRLLTGVRVRVIMKADSDQDKDGKEQACYLKLFPIDETGMRSIYALLSRGFREDRFYYVPRVTWDDITEHVAHEHVALTTGDTDSVAQREDMLEALTDLCARHSFAATFYELVASDTPFYSRQNKNAMAWGQANDFDPIVTLPTFWLHDQDVAAFSINAGIADKRPYIDYLRPVPPHKPHATMDFATASVAAAQAVIHRYGQTDSAAWKAGLFNTHKLVDLVTYEWAKQDVSLPTISADPDAALKGLCKAGWSTRFTKPVFAHQPTPAELAADYLPRLKFELDVLQRLGFAQYFLLVADLVTWSKSKGIYVGPGRGSVGGSLVAYLTGITDVDPIRFKLLFERFINPDRLDLPDADLDFMSTRREEVVTYLRERWGADKVAGIVNYNTMGARSAVRDVGRIHGMAGDQLSATSFIGDTHGVSANLEQSHEASAEIRDFARLNPGVWRSARRLEGKMRAYGTHAAGVVVAGCPLTERAVVERRGGNQAINWDKRVSEEQGLVKLDVLGLSTLDMFDYATKLIFRRQTYRLDINAIPLDDDKTLDVFSEARTAGVFQFEGGSVRRLLKEMAKVGRLNFEDLVALNALNRPGPLDAGITESYIARRAGKEAVTYPWPSLGPILRDTYGVIAYQEQVMQVSRELCGFTPGEADMLRKIMGKKLPEEMAKQRDKFVNGAVATSGMPQAEADRLFTDIEGFAGYAFNRSHAVEYTLIAYQAAFLKAHYGVEFYAASMSIADDDKLQAIVKQAKADGVRVIPPDINVSTGTFEPLNDVVIAAPLSAVKNVSSKGAEAIVKARTAAAAVLVEETTGRGKNKVTVQKHFGPGRFVSLEDFQARVPARLCNSRAIEHLDRVGAFARIIDGQRPATCSTRQRDQIELMPALSDQGVQATRKVLVDEPTYDALVANHEEMEKALGQEAPAIDVGKKAKFMVILDAPFNDYQGVTNQHSYREFVAPALHDAGLCFDDAVWTWVLKRPKRKGERDLPSEEIQASMPFLKREVEICQPPVIVTLGATATKVFFPDMKQLADHVGRKTYSAAMDSVVIVGFNPTQIYHDATKRDVLKGVFDEVRSLIENND